LKYWADNSQRLYWKN